jgi:nucleotide-binding universal stress UspA family protein
MRAMPADEKPAYVVVAAIDFSPPSVLALDDALRIAGEHPTAALHVVHVASSYGPMLRLELEDDIKSVAAEEANELLAAHVQQRVDERKVAGFAEPHQLATQIRSGGGVSSEIVAFAAEVDADLLVIGTHGRTGVRRLLLGSVAETIVRDAGCPVLVVRTKDYEELST